MESGKVVFTSIDEYIASFPEEVQKKLEELRATIKAAAPDAEEKIRYQIPSFTLNGKGLVSFAGWKKHIAMYPIPSGTETFNQELSKYIAGKGTLRFPLDKPLPLKLIGENPPPGFPSTGFGTTIRFYDPKVDAHRIIWIDPVGSIVQTFVARPVGDEIILEGKTVDNKHPERWIFSEITDDSFHWRAVESRDDGKTWQMTQNIWARRADTSE